MSKKKKRKAKAMALPQSQDALNSLIDFYKMNLYATDFSTFPSRMFTTKVETENKEDVLMPPSEYRITVTVSMPHDRVREMGTSQNVQAYIEHKLEKQLGALIRLNKTHAITTEEKRYDYRTETKLEVFVFTRQELMKYIRDLEDYIKEGMAQC